MQFLHYAILDRSSQRPSLFSRSAKSAFCLAAKIITTATPTAKSNRPKRQSQVKQRISPIGTASIPAQPNLMSDLSRSFSDTKSLSPHHSRMALAVKRCNSVIGMAFFSVEFTNAICGLFHSYDASDRAESRSSMSSGKTSGKSGLRRSSSDLCI